MAEELGERLAAAAGQSRGLAALAAQRLAYSRGAQQRAAAVAASSNLLPAGTRRGEYLADRRAADAAR
eukprot:1798798-Prymnesium_polylepis.2